MESCDVLIVGAGPTALIMALELDRYGIDYRIIDKSSGPTIQSRALAIQPRTLELLHFLGLEAPFLERGPLIKCEIPIPT